MIDISAVIGPALSALCAFGGSWLAFSTRLARVETKVDMLADNVEKHNKVVERTYKLESDMDTMWHRHDELKDEVHGYKVGGTK